MMSSLLLLPVRAGAAARRKRMPTGTFFPFAARSVFCELLAAFIDHRIRDVVRNRRNSDSWKGSAHGRHLALLAHQRLHRYAGEIVPQRHPMLDFCRSDLLRIGKRILVLTVAAFKILHLPVAHLSPHRCWRCESRTLRTVWRRQ